MKPLGQKSYGHIPHLPGSRLGPGDHKCHDGQAKIATVKTRDKHDLIIVQEKLDGSNVGVAKLNGRVLPLIRSGYLAEKSNYEQHHYFAKWAYQNQLRFEELLKEGERICGEWLLMAHGTRYDLKHEPFVAFDILTGIERVTYLEFSERALKFDFVIPNLLHIGEAFSIERAVKAIEKSGHGAIDEVEGAVWRVERRGKVDFLCKYVNPQKQDGKYFPEVTGQETVWNAPVSDFKAPS